MTGSYNKYFIIYILKEMNMLYLIDLIGLGLVLDKVVLVLPWTKLRGLGLEVLVLPLKVLINITGYKYKCVNQY